MKTSFLSLIFISIAVFFVSGFSLYSLEVLDWQGIGTEVNFDKSDELVDVVEGSEQAQETLLLVEKKDDTPVDNGLQEQTEEKIYEKAPKPKSVCDGVLCNGECRNKCPDGYTLECPSVGNAQCIKERTSLYGDYMVSPDSLDKKNINIETIVLVKCEFRSQYFDISQTPWSEEMATVGSGVIVSSDGYVLTARHVVEVSSGWLNDPAGREWNLNNCKVAKTDKSQTPILAIQYWGVPDDLRFKNAEIVFKSPDEEYKDASGLDVAILKADFGEVLSFAEIVPKIVDFSTDDLLLTMGYPGKISAVPQSLERFDGSFVELTYLQGAECNDLKSACGLRYESRRSSFLYQDRFWKATELGVITPWGRGGFSGGPAFYEGNLIGIVTHVPESDLNRTSTGVDSNWETNYILSSYDISEILSRHNVDF